MNTRRTDELLDFLFEHAVRHDPASVVDAIDRYARVAGGMIHLGKEKGEIFERIIRRSGARRVLELGTNYGYSALRLARTLGPGAAIHTVEIDPTLARTATAILEYAGLEDRVRVFNGEAHQIVADFSEPFDLVFIDHYPENYLPDLRLLERRGLLRPGTTIVTDNVVIFEGRLNAYLDHLRSGGSYRSELHHAPSVSDGIEVSLRVAETSRQADAQSGIKCTSAVCG